MTAVLVAVVVVVVVVLALGLWASLHRRRQRQALEGHFGAEYLRPVEPRTEDALPGGGPDDAGPDVGRSPDGGAES